MASRRIYLPSPREPSGATWLINCLLELGIRTFRESPGGMWRREKTRWALNDHERVLRKWLPALSDHQSFAFRDDVEVQWMHEWRSGRHANSQIVYFVRDPRDALFSRYKREAPELSFAEFAAFPDVHTLLDKVVNWRLFNATWLAHPQVSVVRFEDYKVDAEQTLANVLRAIGLQFSDGDIFRATQASTYERAAEAERSYRAENPEDSQLINRSGRAMGWQTGEVDGRVIARLESVCKPLLQRLGYPVSTATLAPMLGRHVPRLRFFDDVILDPADIGGDEAGEDAFHQTLEFALALTPDLLTRAQLPAHELAQLGTSLAEYLASIRNHLDACFGQVSVATAGVNPAATLRARLRSGLARRARRLFGSAV